MLESDFYIAGPRDGDEQLWWNNEKGWVSPLDVATVFGRDILKYPLPVEGVNIVELIGTKPIASYTPVVGYPPSVKLVANI